MFVGDGETVAEVGGTACDECGALVADGVLEKYLETCGWIRACLAGRILSVNLVLQIVDEVQPPS